LKIEVIQEENSSVFDTLVAGVRAHRYENMGSEDPQPLQVVARNDNGHIIGGVAGRIIYKNFLVEVAWVDKDQRGSGLGRKLMELAENEAKILGCIVSQVDTLSFQAPVFYQKLGFEVVGTVPSFLGSPERYFLVKNY
jgi:ribosomal protein S18 acetylase RimI-like enzyme